MTTISFAEEPVHPNYPFVFDMTGKLERISEPDIVVEDVLCKLIGSTTYHSPDTVFTNKTHLEKGDYIGLILKDKHTREVESIWIIKKAD